MVCEPELFEYLCSPILCICPAPLAVCWTQQGLPSLSSQLAAVSFLELSSMEGVGRLGSTKVKVEEILHSHLRYPWLYG